MKTSQVEFHTINVVLQLLHLPQEGGWRWFLLCLLKTQPRWRDTPPLRGLRFILSWARGQDQAEVKADFDFPWNGLLISLLEWGGYPIKRTCKYIWLWESNSPLGKHITFPEPCYILNFSLSMAHIKWLELPHTFPSASLKIVQPCSGFHQW